MVAGALGVLVTACVPDYQPDVAPADSSTLSPDDLTLL